MTSTMEATTLGVLQVSVLAATAPLLNGLIKSVKARLQLRRGPSLFQGYRDLAKWFGRAEQVADSTSFMHWLAPVVVMAAILAATLLVPVFGHRTPLTLAGDLFVFVSLLALARAFLTLGGMDSGSAFGEMGSSRELAVSALVEPVLLLSLVALAIGPGSTRLGDIVAFGDHNPTRFLGLGWALSAAAFAVVLVAETGRIPVDNPDTHLELTMIHEGMLIEYSGRSLGMLQFASMLKQAVLVVLFVNVFLPFGLDRLDGSAGYALGALLVFVKVGIAGVGLGLVESVYAKMRFFELPDLIGAAGFTAALGAALRVLFQ